MPGMAMEGAQADGTVLCASPEQGGTLGVASAATPGSRYHRTPTWVPHTAAPVSWGGSVMSLESPSPVAHHLPSSLPWGDGTQWELDGQGAAAGRRCVAVAARLLEAGTEPRAAAAGLACQDYRCSPF